MISMTQDSYNRRISQVQILSAYRIFQKLFPQTNKIFQPTQETLTNINLQNQRQKTIQIDCHRTRSSNITPELKKKTQYLLTYYCQLNNIQYKQGLNQIIAPFMLFHTVGASLTECYNMFRIFFQRFCLNFYQDKDFNSLQMMFKMVSIVLRYHSPSLSRYLQIHEIEPQIFAISWLMTLFSSKLSLQLTYLLWQFYALENDIYFLFFIVVGIILWKSNSIIESKNHSIFKIVTDMIFKTEAQLIQVIKISLIIRKDTPASLTMFFRDRQIFNFKQNYEDIANLLNHIVKLNLFLILPNQLSLKQHFKNGLCQKQCFFCDCRKIKKTIQFSEQDKEINKSFLEMRDISNDLKTYTKSLEYVIIDLRKNKIPLKKQEKYQDENQREVFQIDIKKELLDVQSQFMSLYVQYLSKKHFVFLLTTFTFEDVNFSDKQQLDYAKKFISILNSYSFPHLGILQGGYTALSIFDSELQIKSALYSSNKSIQIKEVIPVYEGQKKKIFDTIYKLSISEMYQISNRKFNKSLTIFYSQNDLAILVTNYFVILVEQAQGFLKFLSYLEHNTSITTYLYSHTDQIKCKTHKIIPIRNIKKISVKTQKPTIIVLKLTKYDDNHELHSLKNYINMTRQEFKHYSHQMNSHHLEDEHNQKINQIQNQSQKQMKKLMIQMKNEADLKELSDIIMHNFLKKVLPQNKK